MKISLLLISLVFAFFSCKDKKEPVKDQEPKPVTIDTSRATPPKEIKTDTEAVIKESENTTREESETGTAAISDDFDFKKFPSKNYKFIKKAKLDFSSNEGAYNFRTRIKKAYASGTPDFASYYITVTFGCGASCIMGLMMDVRDGKIYGLPLGEETSCLFAEDRAIFDPKSRLFIASICKESPEDKSVYYHAFVWNEERKIFEKIEEKDRK
ncbi:hypothetical protein B0A69_20110 [Chryseobacterium shigense]|uniref:Lipoprotein n=1 Tax=Chryseobacterium shigense TaxID=297244 RepID=A0A1N7I1C6_9FLAO|nr:hypothetical protein [Chryseobacterium shigense]PQA90633.1 hypothetical protein B0A69_20110 [Chryseobacterium shigense]SIS30880.1 hypothetical protein SAMN05421639_1011047 [Chryseobacterium shigense]